MASEERDPSLFAPRMAELLLNHLEPMISYDVNSTLLGNETLYALFQRTYHANAKYKACRHLS